MRSLNSSTIYHSDNLCYRTSNDTLAQCPVRVVDVKHYCSESAAQPAHAPDAAARRQDRRHFEGNVHAIAFPIYSCGAGDGHTVGRSAINLDLVICVL